MQKVMYRYLLRCLPLSLCLFGACGSEAPADHSAALPHNMMDQQNDLSEAESRQLMEARGKSAQPVEVAELKQLLLRDTAQVVAVNFWQRDCSDCLALQQHLQRIQTQAGAGKLSILSLNLDPFRQAGEVNLALRTAGITSPVLQLNDPQTLKEIGIEEDWDGRGPALAIFNKGALEAFYRQSFTENELKAVLQSFLL